MKITLINPPCRTQADKHWAHLPLGIGYIAASLIDAGHEVLVVDGKLGDLSLDETVAKAVCSKPDLIGISAMTVEIPLVLALAKQIKDKRHAPIILGGSHSNAVGSDTLRECNDLDFCCVGEGEQLIKEVVNSLEIGSGWEGIKGLIYRRNGEIIVNNPRSYLEDLDSLTFPAWHLFPKAATILVITHRGCPFNCIFCSHNSGYTPRYRSVHNVLSEQRIFFKE